MPPLPDLAPAEPAMERGRSDSSVKDMSKVISDQMNDVSFLQWEAEICMNFFNLELFGVL